MSETDEQPSVGSLWTDVGTSIAEDLRHVYVVVKTGTARYMAECYVVSEDGGVESDSHVHLSWFAPSTATTKTFTRLA